MGAISDVDVFIGKTNSHSDLQGPQLPFCGFMTSVDTFTQGGKEKEPGEKGRETSFQMYTIHF